jgi:REP element-mobilizing transposase RayT
MESRGGAPQLAIKFPRVRERAKRMHGGRRAGAGRKPANGVKAGMPHTARPRLSRHHPVHVTVRVARGVERLRKRRAYQCASWALIKMIAREGFRVVHVSIQANHVHLLVEADDERELSRGVRAFEISFARRLNRACGRKGRVFADRYHASYIETPRQARNAFAYVLNNWRKHREDAGKRWRVDPYSSAVSFDGWKHRARPFEWPPGYAALPVKFPMTWLLTDGWRTHGLIDDREIPGPPD